MTVVAKDIPDLVKLVIFKIIMVDEGGWKLTHNAADPDGGWTYAGVTAKTFQGHCQKLGKMVPSYQDMVEAIEKGSSELKNTVYEIYYNEYYKPLEDMVDLDGGVLQPVELSCAVNCGIGVAKHLFQPNDFKNKEFCQAWVAHYVQLVVNNARAWMEYAETLEHQYSGTIPIEVRNKKPSTFRADFLQGWINRVERYRDGD